MHTDHHHASQPVLARPALAARLAMVFAALLTSSTLLGGVLGLFEMRSNETALARAPSPAASGTVAARELRPSNGRS
jgi:hypothetical protein